MVKRLRRRPLTPQTWVRFPYGSPLKNKLRIVRFRASAKTYSLRCFFVSNFNRFAGLKFERRKKFPLDIPRKSVIILTVEKMVRREKYDVFFAYFLFKRKVQLVLIRARVHPFPFRTRKLSSLLPKILVWRRTGKIGNANTKGSSPLGRTLFLCLLSSVGRACGC